MTLLVVALGVYRVTRLLVEDSITDPMRDWISARSVFFGEMLDCIWCASVWVGFAAALGLFFFPEVAYWVALPFALSAVAGFLSRIG